MVGFFACYGTANMGSSLSWRLPFTILACLSLAFSVSSFLWLVPSPRWLTLRGRGAEAPAAWDKLGVGHAEREKAEIKQSTELRDTSESTEAINQQDIAAPTSSEGRPVKNSFLGVFKSDVRTRTSLAVFLMGMQQLSGIDGVLYVCLTSNLPLAQKLTTLIKPLVCAPPLQTSWPRLTSICFSCLRCLNHRHLCRYNPCYVLLR
jgi:DNA-directed RNA polymerase III subunit RPC2